MRNDGLDPILEMNMEGVAVAPEVVVGVFERLKSSGGVRHPNAPKG